MDSQVVVQGANEIPTRKSAVLALTVDSTARAYDISGLAFGGYTPDGTNSRNHYVNVYIQAETADIYICFDSTSTVTLDNTAKVAAGGTLAFANTYGAVIIAGTTVKCRILRPVDKYMHVKTASTSGVLRMWASSESAI